MHGPDENLRFAKQFNIEPTVFRDSVIAVELREEAAKHNGKRGRLSPCHESAVQNVRAGPRSVP